MLGKLPIRLRYRRQCVGRRWHQVENVSVERRDWRSFTQSNKTTSPSAGTSERPTRISSQLLREGWSQCG